MNNEPVAYGMLTFCKNCGEQNPYSLREITDEEIHQVFRDTWDATTNPNCVFTAFARAILRKAQEK